MDGADRYRQAIQALPPRLRQAALTLSDDEQQAVEEIRLRVGHPPVAISGQGERSLGEGAVTRQELQHMVELVSRASVHTVLDQIRRGYLTAEGGHRIGLCGTVVLRDGEVVNLRSLSSANLRIARQIPGAAAAVMDRLCCDGRLESTLILAAPGQGKTTLLRDVIRTVSEGEGCRPHRVAVADDRGEIAGCIGGMPQMDVGRRTDVLEGAAKAEGLMMLLRAMNPHVLAVDEVTDPADVQALQTAKGCGVILLATAHGNDREDLAKRPVYRPLLEDGLFRRLVLIRREGSRRIYQVEELA